jgi:hypothetical protein
LDGAKPCITNGHIEKSRFLVGAPHETHCLDWSKLTRQSWNAGFFEVP